VAVKPALVKVDGARLDVLLMNRTKNLLATAVGLEDDAVMT